MNAVQKFDITLKNYLSPTKVAGLLG